MVGSTLKEQARVALHVVTSGPPQGEASGDAAAGEGETREVGCAKMKAVLREPMWMVQVRAEAGQRARPDLRRTVSELRWRCPELRADPAEALEEPWSWAQREQSSGRFEDFPIEELVALGLCCSEKVDFLGPMGRALHERHEQTRGGHLAGSGGGAAVAAAAVVGRHWQALAAELTAAAARLRRSQEPVRRFFYPLRLPRGVFDEHFAGRAGAAVCFCAALRGTAAAAPALQRLGAPAAPEDTVACLIEFDATACSQAVDISCIECVDATGLELLLPPFARGTLRSVQAEVLPGAPGMEVQRVRIEGVRALEPLPEVLEAPEEAALAGALLVGLHASPKLPQPTAEGGGGGAAADDCGASLLAAASGCFRALSLAAEVRCPEAVQTVWKGYLECLLQDIRSWDQLKEGNTTIIGVAKTAVFDVAAAARGVTKRALGCESCKNRTAMEEERIKRLQQNEDLKRSAVAVARDQVVSLGLETLTDPEAFLRFIQHDPVRALEAAPAAARAYVSAEPAQRVLLFAKLMGLVAMAGGLIRGEPKVSAAFKCPFPLQEDPWSAEAWDAVEAGAPMDDEAEAAAGGGAVGRQTAARRALALLRVLRLRLARTRLLVAGGAPDVGKTTILREVFGFKHFIAGLSRMGQTEQITFAMHPDGDEHLRPVYAVDTPGFGDGEQVHRNDMVRLLSGAGDWLPGGVTLLWVMKAGRNVRQEADELLRTMAAGGRVSVLVVVTHMDNLFEERYREVGPLWRDGILKGVPHKDPRWEEQRRLLLQDLKAEVEAGVAAVAGGGPGVGYQGLAYACLAGWMAGDEADEEDEFAQTPPWPWARRELMDFFGVMGRQELRAWLDAKLGLRAA